MLADAEDIHLKKELVVQLTRCILQNNTLTKNGLGKYVRAAHYEVSVPEIVKGKGPIKTTIQTVSKNKKKNFCLFCKGRFTQLPRHLEKKHPGEPEVKKFSYLQKKCPERKQIIEIIRKKGNFQHNGDFLLNTGTIIPTRRTKKENVDGNEYIACSKCMGFYAKSSIRKHFKKCSDEPCPGKRNIFILGRAIQGDMCPKANTVVRQNIFPVLRDDDITRPLRYDELVVTYANKMSIKYPKPHNFPMIRSKIRLIGTILHEMRKNHSNIQFSDIFSPQQYENTIKAIQTVAGLDITGQFYKSPSTASAAGTLLKKCGQIYITELIKQENFERKLAVENFLKLLEVDFGITVNKTVSETKIKNKRLKKVILPSIEDIRLLNKFLKQNRQKCYTLLQDSFDICNFKQLQKFTLTSLQVFNRRRAGEVQRIEISDFNNLQRLQDFDKETLPNHDNTLDKRENSYSRFTIRGKLGREVPVLLYKELENCINLLNKHRVEAGLSDNPYIFGIPFTKNLCLDACSLMREFSVQCDAKKPETLRGTALRKQVATQSRMFNLNENEVKDLADFMGHKKTIHEEYYRTPIVSREITRMSRLLEMAQGDVDESDQDEEESTIDNQKTEIFSENSECLFENCESTNMESPTSSKNTPKRRSWKSPEIEVVKKVFKKNLEAKKLPTLKQCNNARISHPELKSRSPAQIKVWISNQLLKKSRRDLSNRIKRTHWNSREVAVAEKIFEKYISDGILPSANTCREAIKANIDLRDRNYIQLKLWVNNQIKKKGKNTF